MNFLQKLFYVKVLDMEELLSIADCLKSFILKSGYISTLYKAMGVELMPVLSDGFQLMLLLIPCKYVSIRCRLIIA